MATHQERVDRALAGLDEVRRFSPEGAEVAWDRPSGSAPKSVISARIDFGYAEAIQAEAQRTGLKASQVVNDLIGEALAARASTTETVTVNLGDLHRALDAAARRAVA